MNFEILKNFPDYELLDSGDGLRLERFGRATIIKPDPQAIWEKHLPRHEWDTAHAVFDKRWQIKNQSAFTNWQVSWKQTKFLLKPSPFKHTGIFPEQAAHWGWMEKISAHKKLKVLNLFAYTGGATMALTKQGHFVTHVDASKPTVGWAKENQKLNGFADNAIRWILDDAVKFVKREVTRGQTYDGIIMDPPAFGHSPDGKTWKFSEDFPKLLRAASELLSKEARFILVNAYATNMSAVGLHNICEDILKDHKGSLTSGELCLEQTDKRLLSTGIFTRWENK